MISYVSEAICRLGALNPDSPTASTAFVANSHLFQLAFLLAARFDVVTRSNKNKSF